MKLNLGEVLGLNPDERTNRMQDLAGRRAYFVLAFAMLFYGLYELIALGHLVVLFSLGAVAVSCAYLLWQRNRNTNDGALDERSRSIYHHQFRFANSGLFLICAISTFLWGGLWVYLMILPTFVILATLLTRRAYPGRVWIVWLAMGLLFGLIGFFGVRGTIAPTLGWIFAVLVGIFSAWYTVKAYQRPYGI